jgi:hypothetical protein
MAVPAGFHVAAACPSSVTLSWDSIPTASAYDVFMLGTTYMDSIGTTSNAFYQVQGTSPNQNYWFAVRARAADGAQSRRTIAIEKQPGIFNCQDPNDAGIAAVTSPGSNVYQICAGINAFPVKVVVENFGSNALSNIPVSYRLDAQTPVTEIYAGPLPAFATDTFAFSAPLSPTAGPHSIEAWTTLSPDNYASNDSAISYIEIAAGTVVSPPFVEDFEAFALCTTTSNCGGTSCLPANGWLEGGNGLTDEIDWRPRSGSTPTSSTGPSQDHNPGNAVGRYMYLEASTCFEKAAELYSPCIDLSSAVSPELEFWYNMNGNTMGRLYLDVFVNGTWQENLTPSISGNWGDVWRRRQVDLSPYAGSIINLRWRGVTGQDENSDMAIDDISIMEMVSIGQQVDAPSLMVFPNPNSGRFNFTIGQLNAEKIRLSIVDLAGRIVIQQELLKFTDELSGQFDMSDQSAGVYFLKVEADGRTFGKRITVQR